MTSTISTTWIVVLVVLAIWDLVWRGMALWKAGKRNQLVWFVVLLIINSVGVLPIVYLLISRQAQAKHSN